MRALFLIGIALLVGCFGVALAAIWTHGETAARLAGTAFAIGLVGAFLTMVGYTCLPEGGEQ